MNTSFAMYPLARLACVSRANLQLLQSLEAYVHGGSELVDIFLITLEILTKRSSLHADAMRAGYQHHIINRS